MSEANVVRRGVYNIEYFSGAQVSLYIGDVWVDEVTTLAYGYQQSRAPNSLANTRVMSIGGS